jgi:D-alanyl-lipoteichoic acid acyltransferase DltB (MBOAT superfamily)
MLFHTYTFAIFFVIAYAGYLITKGTRWRESWILLTSYIFYGWYDPIFLLLIVYSTVVDFYAVKAMFKWNHFRKLILILSIGNNILLLCYFKYIAFLVENLNFLFEKLNDLGMNFDIIAKPSVLLPVGISFFTFQSITYTVECYRKELPPEKSFVRFAAFVAFFPQLMAGPIQRATSLLPQLSQERKITMQHFAEGATLFYIGLFKKVALADFFAIYADMIFKLPREITGNSSDPSFTGTQYLFAVFAFAWQIYLDFSGYTDMARGLARTMGVNFPTNFNHPYLATSLGDFWRRWHISLSTWFRDYVFIPLGGSRGSMNSTYRNIILTMVISGFWHGASWNFIIWGFLNAMGRVMTIELETTAFYKKTPIIIKQMGVFLFICVTWVFFRTETFSHAVLVLCKIFEFTWQDPQFPIFGIVMMGSLWMYQNLAESKWKTIINWRPFRISLMTAMMLYILFLAHSGGQFIYFQF